MKTHPYIIVILLTTALSGDIAAQTADSTHLRQIALDFEADRPFRFRVILWDWKDPTANAEEIALAAYLKSHPDTRVRIESHLDCRGNEKYKLALSERLAKRTKNQLFKLGVAPEQIISAIGYGEQRPLSDCSPCSACDREDILKDDRIEVYRVE